MQTPWLLFLLQDGKREAPKTQGLAQSCPTISTAAKETFALWLPLPSADTRTVTLKRGPGAVPRQPRQGSEERCRCAPTPRAGGAGAGPPWGPLRRVSRGPRWCQHRLTQGERCEDSCPDGRDLPPQGEGHHLLAGWRLELSPAFSPGGAGWPGQRRCF